MKQPKVGESYFLVPNDNRNKPRYVTVKKVGRKFFYIGNDWDTIKFNITTFTHDNDGYSPAYTLYDSEEHYQCKQKVNQCFQELCYTDRLIQLLTDTEIIELYAKLKARKTELC